MIFTPEDIAAETSRLEMEAARTDGRTADERCYLRQDGSRFWGLNTMMRLQDNETGQHVGYVKIVSARKRRF